MRTVFTIGHSTRSIDEFIKLLQIYEIKKVVDVRSIAKSRHNPQFNEEDLKESLEQKGIQYQRIKHLGGLRKTKKDSINLGWHNASFRGYADYMSTPGFKEGLEELVNIAAAQETAIMCAEAVPWRCHRSLIGDALTLEGWVVRDIMTIKSAPEHRLTPFLRIRDEQITYPDLNPL